MIVVAGSSLYDELGVPPTCSIDELRSAYRTKARALHPDVSNDPASGTKMAELNQAWHVLSDPSRRKLYDAEIGIGAPSGDRWTDAASSPGPHSSRQEPDPSPGASPNGRRSRRDAWVAGIQAQIARLSQLAGRSATQTLLLKNPRGQRSDYETVVELIVASLIEDTEPRVRAARAAGAAPLDLGVAATLIGIRTLADGVRRQSSLGVGQELMMTAELIDRMWDVLAHELTTTLEISLGGNPHVARAIAA